ncbi:MAG: hypothetical protein IJ837_01515 [Clostridia bacterium]|nr:hypothetical protein [Clostridia bacterium]
MWWIWPVYVILLVAMTFSSIVLARIVDTLDKKTKMSGGFLGGILLAGVTSLPELITSLTAIFLIGNQDMTFGNIIGSNFFDVVVIGIAMLLMFNIVKKSTLSKNTGTLILLCFFVSLIILVFNIFNISLVIPAININILSIVFVIFYVFVVILSGKKDDIEKEAEIEKQTLFSKMSTKQITLWFVLCAIFLVGVSVGITYVTDHIATSYNIGSSIAGALFLGVATSLPEVITCLELTRLKNFNMALNDIYGSCMFNLLILTLTDIFYFKGTIFSFNTQTLYFLSFMVGVILLTMLTFFLRRKNSKFSQKGWIYFSLGLVMTVGYILSMVLSAI